MHNPLSVKITRGFGPDRDIPSRRARGYWIKTDDKSVKEFVWGDNGMADYVAEKIGKVLADILPNLEALKAVIQQHTKIIGPYYIPHFIKGFFWGAGAHRNEVKKHYWPSICFHVTRFMDFFTSANNKDKVFLDVGSCNGEKVALANYLGFKEAIGLEVSRVSSRIARKRLKRTKNTKVICGDAFNRGDLIAQADVVYTYCPIKFFEETEMFAPMLNLYFHIVSNLKVGATHTEVYPVYDEAVCADGCKERLISHKVSETEINFVDAETGSVIERIELPALSERIKNAITINDEKVAEHKANKRLF